MGLGPSRLTYEMPPPPVLSKEDLDLSLEGTALQDRIVDQEGYFMCRRVAIREGVLAASVAMAVTGLTIMLTKRKAVNFPTVQALLNYSPGVLFLVTSSGLATAGLFTEITLHDCTIQRGIFLQNYYESIGLHAIEEVNNPNREKTVNWNVKRKYQDGVATTTSKATATSEKL